MELPDLEPMKVGEIVRRSFRLYGANFLRFLGIVAVAHIPHAAMRMPYVLYRAAEKAGQEGEKAESWEFPLLEMPQIVLLCVLSTLVWFVISAAIFASVTKNLLGDGIGLGEAYRLVWARIKTVLVASVLWTLCIVLPFWIVSLVGLVSIPAVRGAESASKWVYILPCFVFVVLAAWGVVALLMIVWFSLTPECIMAEGRSAWQSMKRSKMLVKGNVWRVLGLWVVLGGISLAVSWIAGWGGDVFLKTLSGGSITNAAALSHLRYTLVYTVLGPWSLVAGSLLFYDLRARKKKFEFELKDASKRLGQVKLETKDYDLIG